ncbi:MAG: hypothetical protein ABSF28_14120 [Terracidiphilus sp.]|jgi:hypothetical protein
MNRFAMLLFFILCPLLTAQQPTQVGSTSDPSRSALTGQPAADVLQPSAASERNLAIKKARTMFISSDTAYLTVSTLDRALLKQKDWEKLGLNIVDNTVGADLELKVDRLVLTHIHTYVLTDKATGIVLASGRVRAFDGVVASGPMAEQIVKALSAGRLAALSAGSDQGF